MKNYKNYINEFKVTEDNYFRFHNKEDLNWIDTKELTSEQFNNYLQSSDFSDFDEDDNLIYRSVDLNGDFYIITPTGINRESANTRTNYYTLLLNNLPSWSEYPKRTHICSSNFFEFNDHSFRVIPINGAKIGVCPSDDIQALFKLTPNAIKLHNMYIEDIVDINHFYESYYEDYLYGHVKDSKPISHTNWDKFKSEIKKEQDRILSDPKEYSKKQINMANTLLDINELDKLLNPEGLRFKCMPYNEYKNSTLDNADNNMHYIQNKKMHEIWLDSTILLQKIK